MLRQFIYPLSVAPEKYRNIIDLNPFTSIFEAYAVLSIGVDFSIALFL